MNEMLLGILCNSVVSLILSTVKNDASKARVKSALMKVRDTINAAYPEG